MNVHHWCLWMLKWVHVATWHMVLRRLYYDVWWTVAAVGEAPTSSITWFIWHHAWVEPPETKGILEESGVGTSRDRAALDAMARCLGDPTTTIRILTRIVLVMLCLKIMTVDIVTTNIITRAPALMASSEATIQLQYSYY